MDQNSLLKFLLFLLKVFLQSQIAWSNFPQTRVVLIQKTSKKNLTSCGVEQVESWWDFQWWAVQFCALFRWTAPCPPVVSYGEIVSTQGRIETSEEHRICRHRPPCWPCPRKISYPPPLFLKETIIRNNYIETSSGNCRPFRLSVCLSVCLFVYF